MWRQAGGSLRKEISPLVKLIHPDLFSQHHKTIQQANMKFLQSLNEIIDTVDVLNKSSRSKRVVDVKSPLLRRYSLSFHVKEKKTTGPLEEKEEESKNAPVLDTTRVIKLNVEVPKDLTIRQTISSTAMHKLVGSFLSRLGSSFEAVHLKNPWKEDDENDPETSRVRGFRQRSRGISAEDPEIKAKIEERMVEKAISMRMTSMFGGTSGKKTKLAKGDVDQYIRNGNVLTTKLNPVEQLHAVEKIRDFFHCHGHLINFYFTNWVNVLVIIDGSLKKNLFQIETVKKRVIVSIPLKYQPSLLVKYLHKSVPQAQFDLPTIDGLKNEA